MTTPQKEVDTQTEMYVDPYDNFIDSLGLDFRHGKGAIVGFHQLGKILRKFNKEVSEEHTKELDTQRTELINAFEKELDKMKVKHVGNPCSLGCRKCYKNRWLEKLREKLAEMRKG